MRHREEIEDAAVVAEATSGTADNRTVSHLQFRLDGDGTFDFHEEGREIDKWVFGNDDCLFARFIAKSLNADWEKDWAEPIRLRELEILETCEPPAFMPR
jgi:hypothetical protein